MKSPVFIRKEDRCQRREMLWKRQRIEREKQQSHLLLFGKREICGFKIEVLNRVRMAEKEPVIFGVTHIGKWDFDMVNEQIIFYAVMLLQRKEVALSEI